MGESPDSHGRLLGAPPASAGPRNISQAYGQPAAGTRAWNGRGRRSNPSTRVLAPVQRHAQGPGQRLEGLGPRARQGRRPRSGRVERPSGQSGAVSAVDD